MPVIVVWFSQWTISKQNEEILQQNDELNKKIKMEPIMVTMQFLKKKTNQKLYTDHCLSIF